MSIQNAWNEALRTVQQGISFYAFSPEVQEQLKTQKESEQAEKHSRAQDILYEKARVEQGKIFPQRKELDKKWVERKEGDTEVIEDIISDAEDLRRKEVGFFDVRRRSLNEQSAAALRQYELTGDEEALKKYLELESNDIPLEARDREYAARVEEGRQARYRRTAEEARKRADENLKLRYEELLDSNTKLEEQIAFLKSEQKMKYTRHKGRTGGDR